MSVLACKLSWRNEQSEEAMLMRNERSEEPVPMLEIHSSYLICIGNDSRKLSVTSDQKKLRLDFCPAMLGSAI